MDKRFPIERQREEKLNDKNRRKKMGIGILLSAIVAFVFFVANQSWFHDSSSPFQLPLSGKVIVVDAGHGGVDGGAVAKDGTMEKDIALNISLQLRDYLQESGALVLLTREGDYDLADDSISGYRKRKVADLQRRLEMINTTGADMFVSIHLNAIGDPRWRGAQTFYHLSEPESGKMAKFIQHELTRNLENTDRLAKAIHNVFLVDRAEIPGVLIEVGFLSHPVESEELKDMQYQQKIAASIYQGLLRHYTNEQVPSS